MLRQDASFREWCSAGAGTRKAVGPPHLKAFNTCSTVGNNPPARGKWDQAIFFYPFHASVVLLHLSQGCLLLCCGAVLSWSSCRLTCNLRDTRDPIWNVDVLNAEDWSLGLSGKGVCVTHHDSGTKVWIFPVKAFCYDISVGIALVYSPGRKEKPSREQLSPPKLADPMEWGDWVGCGYCCFLSMDKKALTVVIPVFYGTTEEN